MCATNMSKHPEYENQWHFKNQQLFRVKTHYGNTFLLCNQMCLESHCNLLFIQLLICLLLLRRVLLFFNKQQIKDLIVSLVL